MTIGASAATATTKVFEYTGAEQSFVVPSGVHNLQVLLVGGEGGEGGSEGGTAAEVFGVLEVSPGETLYIEVGGNGKSSGEGGGGGFNGGAAGGGGAGGGGGASDIRLAPGSLGLSTDTRLVVAAGGGGGAGDGENAGGVGGDAGESGETSEGGNEGGGAGSGSTGGGGGSGCSLSGTGGELGVGGGGGAGFSTNGGGGGGGGLYGGGGGGGGCGAGGGGGGGGSSLVPLGGLKTLATGEPEIAVSYTPPPLINIVTPAGGGSYTLGQAVTANYSCTPQEGSTLEECAGPVANGAPIDTSSLGQHIFTVSAEDSKGGTSSKSIKYTVLAPAPPSPSSAPNTVLGSHPPKKIKTTKKRVKVKFGFSASTAGATFKCKLDNGAFASCTSPKTYKVKAGKHKFSVVAASSGQTDSTPATFSFKVVRVRNH